MPWVTHTLGGIDLLFTNPASSDYLVEDTSNPPEEEDGSEYEVLNGGSGARLTSFSIGKAPHILDIICIGDDRGEADEKRQALQDKLDLAIGGAVVLYEYKEDDSQPEATQWRVLGGIVRPRWRTSQNEQIFALAGRAVSLAKVVMNLSKG